VPIAPEIEDVVCVLAASIAEGACSVFFFSLETEAPPQILPGWGVTKEGG